jgi:hypothetical protein
MLPQLRTFLTRRCRLKSAKRDSRFFRPELRTCEARLVPSAIPHMTYHGGPLMSHVQAETLYIGSSWSSNSGLHQQALSLDQFFAYLTGSPYQDELVEYNAGGFTIGRGQFTRDDFASGPARTSSITDAQIQSILAGQIQAGLLNAPGVNQLYVVFTAPGTVVFAGGGNSVTDFAGYHSTFTLSGQPVYYAVIAYPDQGGFASMTVTASHELAEAVTDPDTVSGWFDDSQPADGEIGDLAGNQVQNLNGYQLQALWSNQVVAVGADAGSQPMVALYDAGSGAFLADFLAYDPSFTGGVRVASADINGDGIPDIITAPGPGMDPLVQVFDGNSGNLIRSFDAYSPTFVGGVNLAVGDVNGDGTPDIVTGADAGGGPHVKVFSGTTGALLASFMAYDTSFRGGVRVAAGDVNGDGHADVITGAGPSGGPHVKVFSGATGQVLASFFAYDPHFTGGVYVAAGDVNGDGRVDIFTGPGAGGGPDVRVFAGASSSLIEEFLAGSPGFSGGVRVAATSVYVPGVADIVTGPGPGGTSDVAVIDARNLATVDSFEAFDPSFNGGIFVG